MRGNKIDNAAQREMYMLRTKKKWSYYKIAQKFNVDRSTVKYHCRMLGDKPSLQVENPVVAVNNKPSVPKKPKNIPKLYIQYLAEDLKRRGITTPPSVYLKKQTIIPGWNSYLG